MCGDAGKRKMIFGHIVYIMTRNSFPDAYF